MSSSCIVPGEEAEEHLLKLLVGLHAVVLAELVATIRAAVYLGLEGTHQTGLEWGKVDKM